MANRFGCTSVARQEIAYDLLHKPVCPLLLVFSFEFETIFCKLLHILLENRSTRLLANVPDPSRPAAIVVFPFNDLDRIYGDQSHRDGIAP